MNETRCETIHIKAMCCWPQSKHITLKPKLGCILLEIENSVGKLLMDKQGGKGEGVSPVQMCEKPQLVATYKYANLNSLLSMEVYFDHQTLKTAAPLVLPVF